MFTLDAKVAAGRVRGLLCERQIDIGDGASTIGHVPIDDDEDVFGFRIHGAGDSSNLGFAWQ